MKGGAPRTLYLFNLLSIHSFSKGVNTIASCSLNYYLKVEKEVRSYIVSEHLVWQGLVENLATEESTYMS